MVGQLILIKRMKDLQWIASRPDKNNGVWRNRFLKLEAMDDGWREDVGISGQGSIWPILTCYFRQRKLICEHFATHPYFRTVSFIHSVPPPPQINKYLTKPPCRPSSPDFHTYQQPTQPPLSIIIITTIYHLPPSLPPHNLDSIFDDRNILIRLILHFSSDACRSAIEKILLAVCLRCRFY